MALNSQYIYLDSAATSSSSLFDVDDDYANPNSVHDSGREAFIALEKARSTIAKFIGAKRPSEIIFTSGATESNNMALFGLARAAAEKKGINLLDSKCEKPKVLVSSIEHESVMMPAIELSKQGFEVDFLPVDSNGKIKDSALKCVITPQTVLIAIQYANTEIGTIQDIKSLCEIAHSNGVVFFSDFVGCFGKIPINVTDIGVDACSASGHKIGTAKGIGILYLKGGVVCKPLIYGSGQERGLRSGTQSVALCVSLQKAVEYAKLNMYEHEKHCLGLKNILYQNIQNIKQVRSTLNEQDNTVLSYIAHLLFKNQDNNKMILHYCKYGIQLSGGPACSSSDLNSSHVLRAIGIKSSEIDGAIRLSFSHSTSKFDIERFVYATKLYFK